MSQRLFLSVFLVFLLIGFQSQGVTRAAYFGAGGEPAGPTTMFDLSATEFVKKAKKMNMNPLVSYDGGHPESEAVINMAMGSKVQPLTSYVFDRYVARLEDDIKTGKLKSGDQILVTMNSHGAPDGSDQAAHTVSSSLPNQQIPMERLRSLRDLAEKSGVRLGILDLSCFSGTTQSLASDKTCVVSVAGNDVGYLADGVEMLARIAPGKNLDQVYREARLNRSGSFSQPRISTPTGKKVAQQMDFIESEMRSYDRFQTARMYNPTCVTESKMKELNKLSQTILALPYANEASQKINTDFRNAYAEYQKMKVKTTQIDEKLNSSELEEICYVNKQKEKVCNRLGDLVSMLDPVPEADDMVLRPLYESAESQLKNPKVVQYIQLKQRKQVAIQAFDKAGADLHRQERIVYEGLYRKHENDSPKATSPCSDFVF